MKIKGVKMSELSKLINIGKEVEKQLNQVGINTYEELMEIGSKQAWLKIKSIDNSACIHRLYALEGAIREVKKSELPVNVKEELKEFYQIYKN
jgi:DNA transformation protein